MTISSTDDPRAGPFNGNGAQTAFPFEFKTFAAADLMVVHTDDAGAETTLVLDSDYSVALNADQDANPGGTATYPISGSPLPTGETLTIVSDLDYTQETDIVNAGGFYPQVIENALDRITMLVKQVNTTVRRALQLAVSTPDGVDVTLPAPEFGSVIGWGASNQLANYPADTSVSTALLEERLADTLDADKNAGLVGHDHTLDYAAGTVGDAINNPKHLNAIDYATIGTDEQLTNPTLTGSPATGWTLANFTSNNPGITHTAGTVGSASQSVTLTAYTLYQISVTLSTTTEGGIAFNVNGVPVLESGGYNRQPVQGSTTYTFGWITATTGAQPFEIFTDTEWAGQITAIHYYEVATPLGAGYTFVPTDDTTERIPYQIKMGRYNAGVIFIGDKNTGAFNGVDATWNVGIGARSSMSNVSGIENTAVGALTLQFNTESRLTAFGYSCLSHNTTGIQNTGVGYKAFGANSTGNDNHGFGFHVGLQSQNGSFNIGVGTQALYNMITDDYNVAVGHQAGIAQRGGTANTYLGALAGRLHASNTFAYSNTASIGDQTKVYGNSGTSLGSLAQVGADGAPVNNSMALGASARTLLANSVKIGNAVTALGTAARVYDRQLSNSDGTAAGITYTAAQFTTTSLTRSGPGANFSDTTPTAAQIVAAMPGAEVQMGYEIFIRNTTAFTLTLLAGAGVTLGGTTTVAAGQSRMYKVFATNIGSGTEAVTVVGIFTAAN